mmetsp:Transcript_28905/g.34354  ORF Transcript_28905/g.34354 Transcript_28905/m.34354 type:complete len:166 (+) Transcript_28905:144-641(+)|eukprot:CAMPEP_0198264424 /NCGR_PEP_ID=MMETSP1447-20131203/15804_1 /TAXON_ID=420782 /ORGANISM="Chaetoceros dichaeta, Strain CCMP1751" /LENGTH=165 /DNA_ID=CAMNT_0043953361 /DNA_START=136 /DNA_END=633 /DNA_ORIENTATION=+
MHFTHCVLSVISFACIAAVDGATFPASCVPSATVPTPEQRLALTAALEAAGALQPGWDQTKIDAACEESDGYKKIPLNISCDGQDLSDQNLCVLDGCNVSEYEAYYKEIAEMSSNTCTVNAMPIAPPTVSPAATSTLKPTPSTAYSHMSIIGGMGIIFAGAVALV